MCGLMASDSNLNPALGESAFISRIKINSFFLQKIVLIEQNSIRKSKGVELKTKDLKFRFTSYLKSRKIAFHENFWSTFSSDLDVIGDIA